MIKIFKRGSFTYQVFAVMIFRVIIVLRYKWNKFSYISLGKIWLVDLGFITLFLPRRICR